MKILAIRGRNIASIEGDFVLDFQREPLASAGLFAIVGPTGAGKSTLLDVMCLALYGKTPRLEKARENNIAIVEAGGKTLSPHDSRFLLRRGCAGGYAEVDFLALSGEPYRARWSVRRSRDRADGALQDAEVRLYNLRSGKEEGGKKGELWARIVQLVGLSFEQFTRSVLLAQGDFATFLKATQADKAEILEKLTGTEIFGRISSEIYKKNKEAYERYRQYETQTESLNLMGPEERESLQAEQKTICADLAVQTNLAEALQRDGQWLDRYAELTRGEREAARRLAEAKAQTESFMAAHPDLPLMECVWQIHTDYADYRRDERDLQRVERQTVEEAAALKRRVAEQVELQKRHAEALAAMQVWQAQYDERVKPNLDKARQLAATAQERKASAKKRQTQYADTYRQWQAHTEALQQQMEAQAASGKILAEEQAYAESHVVEAAMSAQATRLFDLCEQAVQAAEQQRKNAALAEQNREQLAKETADLADKERQAVRLAEALPEQVFDLRSRLAEGQPCPVCGAVHHPWGGRLDVLSEDETKLQAAQSAMQQAIAELNGQIAARKTEVARLEAMSGNYREQVALAHGKLDELLAGLWPDWHVQWEAGTWRSQVEKQAAAWQRHEARTREAEKQMAETRVALSGLQEVVAKEAADWKRLQAELDDLNKGVQALYDEYRQLWGEEKLEQVEVRYKTERQTVETALNQAGTALKEVERQQARHEATLKQLAQERSRLTEALAARHRQILDWLAQHPEIGGEDRLQSLLVASGTDLETLRQQREQWLQGQAKAQSVWDDRRAQRQAHLRQPVHPEVAADQTMADNPAAAGRVDLDALAADRSALAAREETVRQTMERLQARKAELELLFRQDEAQQTVCRRLAVELEKARQVYENWAKLNDLFGSADGGKFKQVAQAYTLDILLGYANRHLEQLSKRYTVQRVGDTLALQVVDGDMLGEIRSVHSLSGGESFLVSLALALGLASLSSNTMRVDSLFIDEGFGSLDADTLQTAMAALDHLQTQGRKIGVITHVAEMTERIPCRIAVEPTGGGGSRVRLP